VRLYSVAEYFVMLRFVVDVETHGRASVQCGRIFCDVGICGRRRDAWPCVCTMWHIFVMLGFVVGVETHGRASVHCGRIF